MPQAADDRENETPARYDGEPDWLAEAQRIADYTERADAGKHGRPSSLRDVARVHKMLRSLADGNYPTTACGAAGFSPANVQIWKDMADQGHAGALALTETVEKAQLWAESSIVSDVRKAARKEQYWAAGMTLLERSRPERWAKRDDTSRVSVSVIVQGADSIPGLPSVLIQPTAPRVIDATSSVLPAALPASADDSAT